jgi:hypothetical protein
MLAAMAAVTARPTEFPNWLTSLKTPPASDWTSGGKASEITRLETVKRTRKECFSSVLL